MRRDRIRLSRRHEGVVYATFAILFASGALWLVARTWLRGEDELAADASPLAPWAMKVHGAAAMAFLVVLGTLLQGHVRQAWHARRSRWTGGGTLAGALLLVVSGYGLYYLGGETAREVASVLHQAVGWVLPALLVWHVRASRRVRAGGFFRKRVRPRRGAEAAKSASEETAGPRAA